MFKLVSKVLGIMIVIGIIMLPVYIFNSTQNDSEKGKTDKIVHNIQSELTTAKLYIEAKKFSIDKHNHYNKLFDTLNLEKLPYKVYVEVDSLKKWFDFPSITSLLTACRCHKENNLYKIVFYTNNVSLDNSFIKEAKNKISFNIDDNKLIIDFNKTFNVLEINGLDNKKCGDIQIETYGDEVKITFNDPIKVLNRNNIKFNLLSKGAIYFNIGELSDSTISVE